jgi:signal transduction histidine kinase
MGMSTDTAYGSNGRRLFWVLGLTRTLLLILTGLGVATIPLKLFVRSDQRDHLQLIALGSCLGLMVLSDFRLRHRTKQLSTIQQTLSIQQQELRQKLRTSLTAAAVAHEVNQPLSSLSLISQRLIEQTEELPQLSKSLPLLQVLFSESQRLVELIEKMRMLLQSVQTEQGPVDLPQVIGAVLTYLNRLIISEQICLNVTGLKPGDPHSVIYGDGAQLQVAITNLIRNSIAALNQDSVETKVIDISLRIISDLVEFSIADSGPGFPMEWDAMGALEDRIFTSTRTTGMGLGLYLVGATVENHRGTMSIHRSAELGGAEVVLRFPLIS